MHLGTRPTRTGRPGFPRRRGDAPRSGESQPSRRGFPPQARGCTGRDARRHQGGRVSPAGAGMHRDQHAGTDGCHGFPRRRGDAPTPSRHRLRQVLFPPQARGCTDGVQQQPEIRVVSPAGAGMHLLSPAEPASSPGFPRRRGDAPCVSRVLTAWLMFPPQARGCTGHELRAHRWADVSPAGAGMHPRTAQHRAARAGFPRRRGDAPYARCANLRLSVFPPQARGCTRNRKP